MNLLAWISRWYHGIPHDPSQWALWLAQYYTTHKSPPFETSLHRWKNAWAFQSRPNQPLHVLKGHVFVVVKLHDQWAFALTHDPDFPQEDILVHPSREFPENARALFQLHRDHPFEEGYTQLVQHAPSFHERIEASTHLYTLPFWHENFVRLLKGLVYRQGPYIVFFDHTVLMAFRCPR